jgi:hypothetical protein
MAKKSAGKIRWAPDQEYTLVPITDPTEQARLDEQRRRLKEGAILYGVNGEVTPFTPEQVLDLAMQLPAAKKHELLLQLAATLAPDQRVMLLHDLVTQLSPKTADNGKRNKE